MEELKEIKKEFDFFEQFRKNWGVVLIVGSFIFQVAYFQFQQSSLNTRLTAVELKASTADANFTELKASLSGIDAKVTILLDKYLKGN